MSNSFVENGIKVSAYFISALLVFAVYFIFSYLLALSVAGNATFGVLPFLIGYFSNRSKFRISLTYKQNVFLMSIFHALGSVVYMFADLNSSAVPMSLTYALIAESILVYVIYRIGIGYFSKSG